MGASSGAIRAGKAFVELFADGTALTKGLRAASGQLKTWGAKLASIGKVTAAAGGAMLSPFLTALGIFGKTGSELAQMSARTGASVESLSSLAYAAEQTGGSMADVEAGIGGVRGKIAEAAAGSDEAMKSFARLGLNFYDLSKLAPDEAFRKVAEALKKIPHPAQRAALAAATIGNADLLPMIAEMEELEKRAQELGITMSAEDAAAAQDFTRSLQDLWKITQKVATEIGASLAPSAKTVVTFVANAVQKVREWVTANKGLIVTVATIAAGVLAAGTAIGVVAAVLTTAAGVVGTIATVLGALLSPIGLTVIAVIGLGYAFFKYTKMGGDALDWLKNKFTELKADATQAFEGVSAAISAGDIGLAMRIVGDLISLEWAKAIGFLKGKWIEFKASAINVAIDLGAGIAGALIDAFASVEKMWNATLLKIMGGVAKVSLMIKKQGPLSKQKNDGIDMGMKIMGGMMDAGTDADAKRRKALVAPVAGLLKMGNGLKKDADLKGLEDDLAKAQQDLKDNVDAAKRKKKEAGQKAQEKIPGGGPELQGMANSVMGTFSAQAVRGFSTGNTVMNAIRDATRDTARNTARIANQDLRNGVGFA